MVNKVLSTLILLAFWAGDVGAVSWPNRGNQNWNQISIIYSTESEPSDLGGFHEIIYANNNESKTFKIQDAGSAENLDGYIRWYEVESLSDLTNPLGQKTGNISNITGNNVHTFANGVAWLRQDDEASIKGISEIRYTVNFGNKEVIYLVCEASANDNLTTTSNNNQWRAPIVSYRQVYIIQKAEQRLKGSVGNQWDSKLPIEDMEALNQNFIQSYEIHTPNSIRNAAGSSIANQTSFRLPERVSNYYIPGGSAGSLVAATYVRWRIYDSAGTRQERLEPTGDDAYNAILEKKSLFQGNNYLQQQIYYITTEVSNATESNATWYPATLLKVFLEPHSEALTEDELKSKESDANYQQRFESFLQEHHYELLEEVTFEKEDDILTSIPTAAQNFSKNPMENVDSYYAFANPGDWADRRNNRMNVGRGEYALYRTLNYPDVSSGSINGMGSYDDYFVTHGYDKRVVDRLWEKTSGRQSGYFMYLDATDDPGVITKMSINSLCPHTTLVVSAWVCDLAHSGSGVSHADVGFTFKRVDGDNEIILSKYYSGSIVNKPAVSSTGTSNQYAKWQQIFFRFYFPEGRFDDEYILEIANNTPNSDGADYAIDDIKVYKSTPAITAQREDACSASTLVVSSDYETLQNNMGWNLDPNVIDETELANATYRKYRYGLMGPNPYAKVEDVLKSNMGNVYFAFTEITGEGDDKKAGAWIVLNKDLEKDEPLAKLGLQYTMRVTVQSDMNNETPDLDDEKNNTIPLTQAEALKREIIMNVRAMNDFLADIERDKWTGTGHETHADVLQDNIDKLCVREIATVEDGSTNREPKMIQSVKVNEILSNQELYGLYEQLVKELYLCLEIPRIRCPWKSKDNQTLYLSTIEVENTDLRFANEIYYDKDGKQQTAKGNYYVVLFSARDIAEASDPATAVDLNSKCALKREIFVVPSIAIKVDTETHADGITCVGEIHTLNANLMVADVDEYGNVLSTDMKDFEAAFPDKGYAYTFDWFLGSAEEDSTLAKTVNRICLQDLLYDFRSNNTDDAIKKGKNFTAEDVAKASLTSAEKALLTDLLGDGETEPRLISGKSISFRWVANVVAMPYAYGGDLSQEGSKLFCTKSQELTLSAESDVPELSVGFPNIDYADVNLTNVPLRLGLVNLKNGVTLSDIPIQKGIVFGAKGTVLKAIEGNKTITVRRSGSIYSPVATLISLNATKDSDKNNLSMTFNLSDDNLKEYFKEGETYSLYIPFGEYESAEATNPIAGSCIGYAVLQIKIVPEYLTWKGDKDDNWYNDEKWNQSTKGELFTKDLTADNVSQDANGEDPITNAFTPLYFTKITIPEGVLSLQDEKILQNSSEHNRLNLEGTTIQYDMAVNNTGDNNAIKVVPYYGNKVSEIYFKPEAKLMNQHFLTYDTARVEFTLQKETPYWMSSPLKAVYAGDMYAPIEGGIQNTPAFEHISFDYGENGNDGTNHRWKLPFYQKAWNKAVAYVKEGFSHNDASAVDVDAVKSNWSIEYNDVWVPYTIGKGFYMRVEEKDATVRLPKADTEYNYQAVATKAATNLSPTGDRSNAGHLAAKGVADGKITISLNDVNGEAVTDVETGKARHFLVGNPYMTYLDMGKFLTTNNTVLAQKYWILENGAPSAIVGTPDVPFENGSENGVVKPMQAFFVELAENAGDNPTITFTSDMMSATALVSETTTKSYSATSPALTITAERGETKSVATLRASDKADNGYNASEDAIVLLDSELDAPVAYTVAGSKAAQVNAVKSIRNIGLGVYNEAGDEATLTIEGLSRLAETLYLYDAHTRKSVKLEGDSYSLQVSGDSHGRYFLRDSDLGTELENTISIYSAQRGKVIVSSLRPVKDIKVVTLNGSQVRRFSVNTTQYTFNLPAGIYMIYASDGEREYTEKVIVR